MERTVNTKFYSFSQNNSGGHFDIDEKRGINEYVIIEALNSNHANDRAEEIGLYFSGCDDGYDCPCCGDRWHRAWVNDGYDVPSIYGEPLENSKKTLFRDSVYVHYMDGEFKKFELE